MYELKFILGNKVFYKKYINAKKAKKALKHILKYGLIINEKITPPLLDTRLLEITYPPHRITKIIMSKE